MLPQADGRPWRLRDYKHWQRPCGQDRALTPCREHLCRGRYEYGPTNATPYFLRHTYASLRLAEQRLSLQEIAEEMGHTVEVLARTYAHVISEYRGQGPVHQDALITRARPRNAPKTPQARLPTARTPKADRGLEPPTPSLRVLPMCPWWGSHGINLPSAAEIPGVQLRASRAGQTPQERPKKATEAKAG